VHSVHWRRRTGGSMTPRRGRLRTTFIFAPQRAQGASMNWSSPMMPSRTLCSFVALRASATLDLAMLRFSAGLAGRLSGKDRAARYQTRKRRAGE
jgi:hypothetical protein